MYYAKNNEFEIYVCSDNINVINAWIERSNGVYIGSNDIGYNNVPHEVINTDKLTFISY